MKCLIITCLFFLSCTDDRSFNDEDFEATPTFEVNLFQTQYSAELINTGNESTPVPNTLHDFIDVDFLNKEVNEDLVGLKFEVLAENSIDRVQNLNFVFYDVNDLETFRVSEPIPAGAEGSPSIKNFTVVLGPAEIERIITSVRAEFFVTQASAATNTGSMQLECIAEASYLFTGE
ncbi:hypothetical protein LB456_06480 [Psychroflexus sp. CAK57W]|uniref:hypothetical protein n=1 Tax=Psychroflexus curvus TaxID=2873595 RepID=UPI001CCAF360|nr:hypothetical protein [Psychroflexus curvus]MBZ9787102.1 hypothetical protein [Psychroflexus curvus]